MMERRKNTQSICFADINKSKLDEKTLQTIFLAILKALQFQHDDHIIYFNNLKPQNIFIHSENNKIYAKFRDMGISSNASFGYEYMSPEQLNAQRDAVGIASDVWTFGVIVFETLCNQLPFGSPKEGFSNEKIIANIMDSHINPRLYDLIQPYRYLVWKCLQFNKDERFRDAQQIIELIENPMQAEEIKNPNIPEKVPEPFEDKVDRQRFLDEVERFQQVIKQEAEPYLPPEEKQNINDVESVKDADKKTQEVMQEKVVVEEKKVNILLWVVIVLLLITSVILTLSFFTNISLFILFPTFFNSKNHRFFKNVGIS